MSFARKVARWKKQKEQKEKIKKGQLVMTRDGLKDISSLKRVAPLQVEPKKASDNSSETQTLTETDPS